jgi:hypothetical protein
MFGIWIGGVGDDWKQFKQTLEGFGRLKWISGNLSDSVIFPDLTLTITSTGHVETKTYIKPKNLYLYIPAAPVHLSDCFKGTIYGNVQRYCNQNSHIEDYQTLAQIFATHLEARGHKIDNIKETLLEAAAHIDQKSNNNKKKKIHLTRTQKISSFTGDTIQMISTDKQ